MTIRRLVTLLALTLAPGCGSSDPDTTPAVQIISPLTNQRVPVGQPISVGFKIGGKDGNVPFQLETADDHKQGRGRIAVLVDSYGNLPVAIANNPAEDTMLVPNPAFAKPADVVKAGTLKLQLWLQYNDGEFLNPQHQGEVTVLVE